jgi:hypothetical protein
VGVFFLLKYSWYFRQENQNTENFVKKLEKAPTLNHLKSHQKNFQPDRTQNGGEKGGKPVFVTEKTSFEKNAK